jgi:ATP-binding cassette, subfamily B, heavy metal transporter
MYNIGYGAVRDPEI